MVRLTMTMPGTMSNRHCSVGGARVLKGMEGVQELAQVGHDAGGVTERRAVDGVVAQAELIGAARQVR